MSELSEELREYTAMKYMGDCKCGKCQLVPRELIDRILPALRDHAPAAPKPTFHVLSDEDLRNGRSYGEKMLAGNFFPLDRVAFVGGKVIRKLAAEIDRLRPYEVELRRIADDLGEPNDPFAAWEKLAGHQRSTAMTSEPIAALEHYADQYCEGWCEKSGDCAHFDDCGGCLARRTLHSLATPSRTDANTEKDPRDQKLELVEGGLLLMLDAAKAGDPANEIIWRIEEELRVLRGAAVPRHERLPPQPDTDRCDCENPEPASGVALVSEDCPIHGRSDA